MTDPNPNPLPLAAKVLHGLMLEDVTELRDWNNARQDVKMSGRINGVCAIAIDAFRAAPLSPPDGGEAERIYRLVAWMKGSVTQVPLYEFVGARIAPTPSAQGEQNATARSVENDDAPAAWIADIAAYADHAPGRTVVLKKQYLSSNIPDTAIVWTPLFLRRTATLEPPHPHTVLFAGHPVTDCCGFDRSASHTEGRYVCMCGWRQYIPTHADDAGAPATDPMEGHPDDAPASSAPAKGVKFAGMPAEQEEMREVAIRLGGWLSAALEDATVCDQMKRDINDWFSVGMPFPPSRAQTGAEERNLNQCVEAGPWPSDQKRPSGNEPQARLESRGCFDSLASNSTSAPASSNIKPPVSPTPGAETYIAVPVPGKDYVRVIRNPAAMSASDRPLTVDEQIILALHEQLAGARENEARYFITRDVRHWTIAMKSAFTPEDWESAIDAALSTRNAEDGGEGK